MVSFTFPQLGSPLADVIPEPLSAMVAGELVALLTTETLPVTLATTVGAKRTVRVVFCPAAKVSGRVKPLALKPAPERFTCEIVTLEFPLFNSVTV